MLRWVVLCCTAIVTSFGSLTDGNWESDFVVIPFPRGSPRPTRISRALLKDGSYRPMYGTSYDVVDPSSGHVVVYPPRDGCLAHNLSLPIETAIHFGGCDVSMNAGFYDVDKHTCLGYAVSNGAWETPLLSGEAKEGQPAAAVAHSVFMLLEGVALCDGVRYNGSYFLSLLHATHPSRGCNAYVFGFVNATDASLLRPFVRQGVSGQVWLVRDGTPYVEASLIGSSYISTEAQYAQLDGTHTYFRNLGDARYFRQLVAPRLAVGRRVVGGQSVMSVVQIDGYNGDGVSLDTLAATLVSMGFTDAINLDGGGSVAVYEGGSVRADAISREELRAIVLNGTLSGGLYGTPVNTPSNDCPGATYPRRKCPRPVASMLCLRVTACPREKDCLNTIHTLTVVNSMSSSFETQSLWLLLGLALLTGILVVIVAVRSG